MKRLSFLELEREMEREDRLIKDDEELKAIEGGAQPSFEQQHFGLLSNNDAFSFKETTVVKNGSMTHFKTTFTDAVHGVIPDSLGRDTDTTDFPTTTIPTSTIPLNQEWMALQEFLNTHFVEFPGQTSYHAGEDVPAGYSLDDQGRYVDDKTGEVSYGVTLGHKNGDSTFESDVYIPPASQSFEDKALTAVIGHEMIHVYNMQAHPDMYSNENTRSQFKLNSEYAGYHFQYNYDINNGLDENATAVRDTLKDLAKDGADTSWRYELTGYDYPDTTNMPTTSNTPTTTVPTTTL